MSFSKMLAGGALAIVLACGGQLRAEEATTTVAVMDLKGHAGITDKEARTISDRIRGEILRAGGYTVIERGAMAEILQEQEFQQAEACSDQGCIVEVGQLLAVRKMVGGSVGRVGGTYNINLKLVDVQSGAIDKLVSRTLATSKARLVTEHVPRITAELLGMKAPTAEKKSLLRRWYFWVPVVAVVGGGAVAAGVLASSEEQSGTGGTDPGNGHEQPPDKDRTLTIEGTFQ